jgi:hypothetical protein
MTTGAHLWAATFDVNAHQAGDIAAGVRPATLSGEAIVICTLCQLEYQPAVAALACAGQPLRSTPRTAEARPGRNDPCWCGSQTKYKRCHGRD